jgi:3-hydroxyisobutyrate dehydrogenase
VSATPADVVGFVGLGNMGWPMARNLHAASIPLVVRDADPGRQRRFAAEHGGRAVGGAADFAEASIVVTMLPDGQAVADALLQWDGGIAPALAPGAIAIDMSSSNPLATRTLGPRLAEHGVKLIDAPVSGGITGAAKGTLSIMVGADDEDTLARARPVLEVLGAKLFHTGPLGSGHAMKALNNYLGAAAYLALAEAIQIGARFGLEPTTMLEVINSSTGRSFNSEVVFPQDVVTRRYGTGFALGLLAKDASIAAALATAAELDAPACQLVSRRWREAAAGLGPGADHSEAHRQWEHGVARERDNAEERMPIGDG